MNWLNKHADAIAVITAIVLSALWMNNNFKDLEKDIAVIKAVMIMQKIMPAELAKSVEVKHEQL